MRKSVIFAFVLIILFVTFVKADDFSDVCTPSWDCGNWSDCSGNQTQTRICTDLNVCDPTALQISESQTCQYVGVYVPWKTIAIVFFSLICVGGIMGIIFILKHLSSRKVVKKKDDSFPIVRQDDYYDPSSTNFRDLSRKN